MTGFFIDSVARAKSILKRKKTEFSEFIILIAARQSAEPGMLGESDFVACLRAFGVFLPQMVSKFSSITACRSWIGSSLLRRKARDMYGSRLLYKHSVADGRKDLPPHAQREVLRRDGHLLRVRSHAQQVKRTSTEAVHFLMACCHRQHHSSFAETACQR